MSTGTGSLYMRKDGYWVAAVSIMGRRVVRYGKTKREAQQHLKILLVEEQQATLTPPSRRTLSEWGSEWLSMVARDRRPTTLRAYRQSLAPVLERAGQIRLDRLTAAGLTRLFIHLCRDGLGSRRVEQSYVVLNTCLKQAVKLGLLNHNPLDQVDKPRHRSQDRRYWTADEARRFLLTAEASGRHYAPFFIFLLATGLRSGEALGLQWHDIDLDKQTVSVERALVGVWGQRSIQLTKSKAGRRVLVLPKAAINALKHLPRPTDKSTQVIIGKRGTAPTQPNLRRALHDLCDLAGVPRLSMHGLRHVHAALLAAEGVDPHSLRRRLGHSRVSTTMDIYAYAVRPDDAAVTAFERVIGGLE